MRIQIALFMLSACFQSSARVESERHPSPERKRSSHPLPVLSECSTSKIVAAFDTKLSGTTCHLAGLYDVHRVCAITQAFADAGKSWAETATVGVERSADRIEVSEYRLDPAGTLIVNPRENGEVVLATRQGWYFYCFSMHDDEARIVLRNIVE